MKNKWALWPFLFFTFLSLLTPFWVFKDLLFPFITSKAFYFRICIELALPFFVYSVLSEKKFRLVFKNWLSVCVLAFLGLSLIAAFAGVNVQKSLWGNFERMGGVFYLTHLALLYFYVLLIGQLEGNYLKRFLQAFIGVSVLIALNGISGYLGGPTLTQDPSLPARASSTLGNPIFFASYLILPMFLSLFLAVEEEKPGKRIWWGLIVFVQLAGIFVSATRGATVGLAIGIFVGAMLYALLSKKPKVRLYGSGVVVAILLMVGLLFAMSGRLNPNSALYRITHLKDNNTAARIIQWETALTGFKDRPVLGVGPENYMVISDKYYNPEMYKYDPSWFDKPHNYLIEILVTTGVVGFAAYLGIFVFSVWAMWRAYKEEYITLLQYCALVAGILAYQIQNIFVFDTVSPSVTFFIFTGFLGYLFYASQTANEKTIRHGRWMSQPFVSTAFAVSAAVVAYVLYIGNITGIQAAHDVNYGYAYSTVDAQKAYEYFQRAVNSPFNFDPAETANKYGDFVMNITQNQIHGADPATVERIVNEAVAYQQHVAETVKVDPIVYQKLGYSYLVSTLMSKSNDFSKAEDAMNRAIELAPKRVEAKTGLVQIRLAENHLDNAATLIREVLVIQPTRTDLEWQLGMIYLYDNRNMEGVQWAEKAIRDGFVTANMSQADALANQYRAQKDYGKIVSLYEAIAKAQPNNLEAYVGLAKAYYEAGQKDKAVDLAQRIVQAEPSASTSLKSVLAVPAPTPAPQKK